MTFCRFITGIFALALAGTLSAGAAQALSVDLITNGDFETGNLSGWNTTTTGYSNGFLINNGNVNPAGPQGRTAPISGNYDVLSSQTGYGIGTLTQFFTVPDQIISATFSFTEKVMNYYVLGYSDPNQEFRVNLINQAGTVISNIFSTDAGDNTRPNSPTTLSYDLTSLLQANLGNTLGVQFQQQDSYYYMNTSLDDIKMMVETPAAVSLPPTIWMMLAALGLFGFLAWKRRDAGNAMSFTAMPA
ncbi:PEP-CTERM sorting domain-containing protein [Thioclava sp. 15-R06ZXC-3]|uniref:PEP-CTERM sorting domain-containing protein n=1 Tax=Thioclava arctica TaxID=3238301 RepID=A0ABV3TEW3_9RHOB